MPRRARIMLAGVPVHIIQRGNNRDACFFSDDDYVLYLDLLRELGEKYGCALHAYCLMTNHAHLLLTPEKADSASLLMKHLGQRYVQAVNRIYRRSGTLWEGRFRSCLAQDEQYVLACYRYIELNPVRANMVDHPREYPWSSYRFNAEKIASPLIRRHAQYLALGMDDDARRVAYRELFRAHMEPHLLDEIRQATNGGFVLGDDRFKAQIAAMLGRRVEKGKAGRPARNLAIQSNSAA